MRLVRQKSDQLLHQGFCSELENIDHTAKQEENPVHAPGFVGPEAFSPMMTLQLVFIQQRVVGSCGYRPGWVGGFLLAPADKARIVNI